MNKALRALSGVLAFATSGILIAAENYCSDDGVKITTFYIVNSNDRNADFRSQAESLKEISSGMEVGDTLEMYLVGQGGDMTKTFQGCKPGCPDVSALGEIFGSSCQKTRAKRDLKVFQQKLIKPFASYFKGGESVVQPATSMYRPFSSISQHITQNTEDTSLVYVIGSLNTPLTTEAEYSAEFVKLVQGTLPALPAVDGFKSVSFNAETISFWSDLFLASGQQFPLD